MRKLIDLTSEKHGRLTVIKKVGQTTNGQTTWLCQCECGKEKVCRSGNLRSGNSTSCGCLREERFYDVEITHGMTYTRQYRIWKKMKSRCMNKNDPDFQYYGGRGITLCERWKASFADFWEDMKNGYSDGLTIDRINVNSGYEPGNCRWQTRAEQANNMRKTIYVQIDDQKMSIKQACNHLGLKYATVLYRVNVGWDIHKAFDYKINV